MRAFCGPGQGVRLGDGFFVLQTPEGRRYTRAGQFTLNGGPKLAHRVAWFLTFGKWPEKDLAHRCDVPTCVNPDHLFEATPIENNRDMIAKGRHPKVGKLTDDQVADIRHRMRGAPRGTGVRLAREFGVSDALISHIVHGKVRTATPAGPIEFQAEPRNRNLKLADDDVQAIRSAYAAGGVSQTELGRTYGVHQTVISGIVRGAKRLPRN